MKNIYMPLSNLLTFYSVISHNNAWCNKFKKKISLTIGSIQGIKPIPLTTHTAPALNVALLMPLVETIKELVSFTMKR